MVGAGAGKKPAQNAIRNTSPPADPALYRRGPKGITKNMSLKRLAQYFHLPEQDAAREIGVSKTMVKRWRKTYGIDSWPYRRITKNSKGIAEVSELLRQALDTQRAAGEAQLQAAISKRSKESQPAGGGMRQCPAQCNTRQELLHSQRQLQQADEEVGKLEAELAKLRTSQEVLKTKGYDPHPSPSAFSGRHGARNAPTQAPRGQPEDAVSTAGVSRGASDKLQQTKKAPAVRKTKKPLAAPKKPLAAPPRRTTSSKPPVGLATPPRQRNSKGKAQPAAPKAAQGMASQPEELLLPASTISDSDMDEAGGGSAHTCQHTLSALTSTGGVQARSTAPTGTGSNKNALLSTAANDGSRGYLSCEPAAPAPQAASGGARAAPHGGGAAPTGGESAATGSHWQIKPESLALAGWAAALPPGWQCAWPESLPPAGWPCAWPEPLAPAGWGAAPPPVRQCAWSPLVSPHDVASFPEGGVSGAFATGNPYCPASGTTGSLYYPASDSTGSQCGPASGAILAASGAASGAILAASGATGTQYYPASDSRYCPASSPASGLLQCFMNDWTIMATPASAADPCSSATAWV